MRIKSFYANSVEGAVSLARREMGAEAMLVESRKAPLEARHLGEYEVVCAVVPEAEPAKSHLPEETGPPDGRLARELAELRRQLDVMGKTITRSAWSAAHRKPASPGLSAWHARLMAADVDGELVQEILDAVEGNPVAASGELDVAVAAELESRILAQPSLAAAAGEGQPIAALIGPPGAGKTTMLAKLAVICGLRARLPLLFLSMDDYRVGGADQLRSYAAILGAGFQSLDNVSGLRQAIEEHHGRRLILIDTPGYGPRDMDRAADLARFLSSRPTITSHLVLTASMKAADLTGVVERFKIFRPSRLLFTRVDESGSFGTAFSISVRTEMPISFLGTGQEIPDDMLPATQPHIMKLLNSERPYAERLAA